MVHKLKTRLAREESGFTLIELLVVLIILAILLAIAIPSYLSFKDRANKTSAESAVRTLVPSIEAYGSDNTPGAPATQDPDASSTDNGYTGMTAAILASKYDQSLDVSATEHVWVNPTDTNHPAGATSFVAPTDNVYCAVAQVADWYAWKAGPDKPIKADKTVANVCT
jgi:prepilin-type N-terminal cleavage/methylation domain-containing protein